MKNLWFITNPGSGSSTVEKCEALMAIFADHSLTVVGRTIFPEDQLPNRAMLETADVDAVVLFAGDGTINAAICALDDWDGAILILPGGTMNLLAKALHGDADPAAIIRAMHEHHERIALSFVAAADHRAFVGLILGPAASWVHARELVRAGRLRGLGRAIRHAWARTFGRGIRIGGAPGLPSGAQAVLVTPDGDSLQLAAIDARDWRSIAQLGWDWLTGDWVAATSVTEVRATSVHVLNDKPVLALFDGEPQQLPPGIPITGAQTAARFISTLSSE
ncbi:diacylglycerol kinase family protein [Sphingomonas sp. 28-62-11]|uniref:diacylglycerol/lipid kinase family protein n=1 Tax=Sphingomonas sp. 28-62-11 TaxID=1970432 RepID=UPI000BDB4528|nr:MAG: hypothetical protein B7Y49_05985 [Sphingomonas sp. 28-62-11]